METEPNAVKGKKQSDKTIFVVVEDGRIQEVYACASLTGVEVEILDKDDAKVSEDAAWRSTLQRIAEVAEQSTNLLMRDQGKPAQNRSSYRCWLMPVSKPEQSGTIQSTIIAGVSE